MRKTMAVTMIPLALGACAPAVMVETPAVAVAAPASATVDLLPAGTMLHVQLDRALIDAEAEMGQFFTATLMEPVVTRTGETVLPQATVLDGTITGYSEPQLQQAGAIRLNFERLTFEGMSFPITARITGVDVAIADSDVSPVMGERAPAEAAARAELGTVIDDPGADMAARIGAETGTIVSLGTGTNWTIPAGARLTIEVLADVPLHSHPS
jgi:hypothetical protein